VVCSIGQDRPDLRYQRFTQGLVLVLFEVDGVHVAGCDNLGRIEEVAAVGCGDLLVKTPQQARRRPVRCRFA